MTTKDEIINNVVIVANQCAEAFKNARNDQWVIEITDFFVIVEGTQVTWTNIPSEATIYDSFEECSRIAAMVQNGNGTRGKAKNIVEALKDKIKQYDELLGVIQG